MVLRRNELYLKVSLETKKEQKLGEIISEKNFISSRDGPVKGQEQGRDEKNS